MAERLDRSHPLWRIDVVERLTGERSALIWRVHHCMADGLTAFRLGSTAIWGPQAAEGGQARDRWVPEPAPGTMTLAALGTRARLAGLTGEVRNAASVLRSPRRLGSITRAAARMPAVFARELWPSAGSTVRGRPAAG